MVKLRTATFLLILVVLLKYEVSCGFFLYDIYFVQINSSDSSILRMFIISVEFFKPCSCICLKHHVILFFILLIWYITLIDFSCV